MNAELRTLYLVMRVDLLERSTPIRSN